jgi:hypothetical protein
VLWPIASQIRPRPAGVMYKGSEQAQGGLRGVGAAWQKPPITWLPLLCGLRPARRRTSSCGGSCSSTARRSGPSWLRKSRCARLQAGPERSRSAARSKHNLAGISRPPAVRACPACPPTPRMSPHAPRAGLARAAASGEGISRLVGGWGVPPPRRGARERSLGRGRHQHMDNKPLGGAAGALSRPRPAFPPEVF